MGTIRRSKPLHPAADRGGAYPLALKQALPRMDVKFPILGFLMESEMTGYDLKRRFQDPVGFFYRASDGSLYPALKKLAADGLVTMRTERRGRRARKIYAITERGRERFLAMLREPAQPLYVFDEAQVKVYFAHHDPGAGLEHLERMHREDAESAGMLAMLVNEMDLRSEDPFRRVVVEMGRAVTAAKAEVVAGLIGQLRRGIEGSRRSRARATQAAAGR
jgi:DNA-binding PadR family transcriptional regulator